MRVSPAERFFLNTTCIKTNHLNTPKIPSLTIFGSSAGSAARFHNFNVSLMQYCVISYSHAISHTLKASSSLDDAVNG